MAQPIFYGQDGSVGYFNNVWSAMGGLWSALFGRHGGKFNQRSTGIFPYTRGPVLIDVSRRNLQEIASRHPHLNTIISRGAELFSMMEIEHLDAQGNEIENSPVLDFLKQPNPLQTFEQYCYQFYVLHSIYSKTFQRLIRPLSFEQIPAVMWLLPPGLMDINVTGKIWNQSKIEDIIESFRLNTPSEQTTFQPSDVIYMADGIGETWLNPVSRIEALQIPLSNLNESLKARNIIVSERGAIGILSRKASTSGGDYIPPGAKEKERIEAEYQNQYGLDSRRGHVIITTDEYVWTPMNFDIGQLRLSEGDEMDFARLCDAYRHDRDLYASTKGATFENKNQGMKSTIQLGIQPLADSLVKSWAKAFLPPGSKETLRACYDHLPVMKEDERTDAQAQLYRIQGLSIMRRDNIISADQYAAIAEVEMDGSGEDPQAQPLYAGTGTIQTPND